MPTLAELLAQKAELERQIAQQQRAERDDAIARVRELMAQFGLTFADIGGAARPAPLRNVRAPSEPRPPAKVAPKYRHPDTGETWSGRGLQPRWLKAALEQGRALAEFTL